MPPLSKSASVTQRQPPPSLFLGPSHNASQVSLPAVPVPGANASGAALSPASTQRISGLRDRSELKTPSWPKEAAEGTGAPGSASVSIRRSSGPDGKQTRAEPDPRPVDRTDALWAEMQSTLDHVELSATHDTHVFGPEHAKALEGLRAAQIGLAQAWARSEADSTGFEQDANARKDKKDTTVEEESENDTLLARKRREANDRYFDKVNASVSDVVAKLEEVAAAMGAVEQESREIWSDTTNSKSTSIA